MTNLLNSSAVQHLIAGLAIIGAVAGLAAAATSPAPKLSASSQASVE